MASQYQAPAPIFQNLRQKILTLNPSEVGLSPTPDLPTVWGLLVETGFPNGISTLVMLADGTTSMYFSSGGGFLGCGEHQPIAEATLECLRIAGQYTGGLAKVDTHPLPAPGQVTFYALTYHGTFSASFKGSALGRGNHPFSALFFASQAVTTQVRLLEENRRPD